MDLLQPTDWSEALAARAAHPEAVALLGGTDVMVDLNFDRSRPAAILDLTRVAELREWGEEDGLLRLGAGVTYARAITELGERLPGLSRASRAVGSPPIRNRGSIGGNLGTASPAGDALPPLFAAGAEVELASAAGSRRLPIADFVTGPRRNALRADELIAAVRVPPAPGPQQFAKVGPRNAMIISICSFAIALDPPRRAVGTCIGSAGPTPLRAHEAEEWLGGALAEAGSWDTRAPLPAPLLAHFGTLAGAAAQPIDDVRGSAAYRRHAVGVLARRTLSWAWEEQRCA